MNKFLIISILLTFSNVVNYAQPKGNIVSNSSITEGLQFESKILGKPVNYCLYLPPDYQLSNRRYPVLYLLHGYSDSEWAWIQFGGINTTADRMILNGDIPAMIIVMPDAGMTYYVNDYQGKVRYEDMFIQELIPFIDSEYRTRNKKEFRAIAGLSMGGYGSLIYAIHHPDLFVASAPLSSATRTEEEWLNLSDENFKKFIDLFGPFKGKEKITRHWKDNNPIYLMQNSNLEDIKKVKWYIDCGDDDYLSTGNSMLHIVMTNRQIPHEYRVRDGAHNWSYWRTGIVDALKFIGDSFQR